MSTNVVTLIVAGSALLGTIITATAGVLCVILSKENQRKLNVPGKGTIGEHVRDVSDELIN